MWSLLRLAPIIIAKCSQYRYILTSVIFFMIIIIIVLVIAWARVANVGYWHYSGLEPESHRPKDSIPLHFHMYSVLLALLYFNLVRHLTSYR